MDCHLLPAIHLVVWEFILNSRATRAVVLRTTKISIHTCLGPSFKKVSLQITSSVIRHQFQLGRSDGEGWIRNYLQFLLVEPVINPLSLADRSTLIFEFQSCGGSFPLRVIDRELGRGRSVGWVNSQKIRRCIFRSRRRLFIQKTCVFPESEVLFVFLDVVKAQCP